MSGSLATVDIFPVGMSMSYISPERVFREVNGSSPQEMDVLSEIFRRILTPLYGSQEKAIGQIAISSDRKCFLLYEQETAVGVLVFKTVLSDEYAEQGVEKSIEIKSLFIDQSVQNSGRGLGSLLVDKVKQEVGKLGLGNSGIHVTVSETKEESLLFFRKKGFEIAYEWKGRYQPGTVEYLLYCPTEISAIERWRTSHPSVTLAIAPATKPLIRQASVYMPELINVIHNAHMDDIHCLIPLADGTFISGSKDNAIKKWAPSGDLVAIIDDVEPTQRNERNWITAAVVINNKYWVSGERNGRVSLWTTEGKYVRDYPLTLPRGGHVSHEYNARRINCLAKGCDPMSPSFFVGFPTMFDEYDCVTGRTEYSVKVHKNDWVYAIHPLSSDRLLTVTGCIVDVWNRIDRGWDKADTLISEGRKVKSPTSIRPQRPFISSLCRLQKEEETSPFACGDFNGFVKVFDVATKKIIANWQGHVGKIWTIEPLNRSLFATSGEDRSIQFWDTRTRGTNVHTISDLIGEATSMLALSDNVLIAGACPKEGFKRGLGADILFYDVRKQSSGAK